MPTCGKYAHRKVRRTTPVVAGPRGARRGVVILGTLEEPVGDLNLRCMAWDKAREALALEEDGETFGAITAIV